MKPLRSPQPWVERYAVLGTIVGGTCATISAIACRGPILASVLAGTVAAAAAGAMYGYARLRAEARG